VIRATIPGRPNLLLLGAVRGLAADAVPTVAALEEFRPEVLGIGMTREELAGLGDYFVDVDTEPLVPLLASELGEVRGLARYGEVSVPHPTIVAALEWSKKTGVTVEPLDPSEETLASQFAEHVGYVELVRRTLRERSLTREPPTPGTPDEFAIDWDRRLTPGAGSARLIRARESEIATNLLRLSAGGRRVVGLVDRERFPGVETQMRSAAP